MIVEPFALVAFIILVIGFIAGGWWRIETAISKGKTDALAAIDKAKTEVAVQAGVAHGLASLAASQLSEHKVHVAETYVTKQGMHEQTQQLMQALTKLGDSFDRSIGQVNQRLDRVIEQRAPFSPG